MSISTQYNKSFPMFVHNIKILADVVPEKSLTNVYWQKKGKGKDKKGRQDLSYKKQQVILRFVLNFQMHGVVVPQESLTDI